MRAIFAAALPAEETLVLLEGGGSGDVAAAAAAAAAAGAQRALAMLRTAAQLGVLAGAAHTRVARALAGGLVPNVNSASAAFCAELAADGAAARATTMDALASLATCRDYIVSLCATAGRGAERAAAQPSVRAFARAHWAALLRAVDALPSYAWAAQSNYFVVVEMVARCARFARGDAGSALRLELTRDAVARVVRGAVALAPSRSMRRLGGVDAATAFEHARWRAITALLALLSDEANVGVLALALSGSQGESESGDGEEAVLDIVADAVVEGFENAAEATSEGGFLSFCVRTPCYISCASCSQFGSLRPVPSLVDVHSAQCSRAAR